MSHTKILPASPAMMKVWRASKDRNDERPSFFANALHSESARRDAKATVAVRMTSTELASRSGPGCPKAASGIINVPVRNRATGRLLPMPKALTGAAAKAEIERRNKEAAERNARSKAALLEVGGRRLTVNLSREAAIDLELIRFGAPDLATDREAVEAALLHYRGVIGRRVTKKAKR